MKLNSKKTNPHIASLAKTLHTVSKKEQAPIWDSVSDILQGPSQNWAEVNIGQLDRLTKDKDVVLVPGKLLAAGTISHALNVYAFSATESAKKQISAAKGKFGTIEELLSHNPKGKGVRLVK
ncbi:TPA: 50S ribosomal protein L18e [archaeon]|nr:50S ribosomal protein L18e [Candidatus Naiadarchaeales archaeon SRR2090159.bin1288]